MRWMSTFGVGLLMAGLVSCAHGPRTVTLTTQELSARLEQAFPVDRRLLEVFDVQVSQPRLRTEPATGRVRADFRIRATDRLGGARLDTPLAVVSGLRWEPSDRTLRLERVELDLPRTGRQADRDAERLQRLGLALAAGLLEDQVVWRAPAEPALAVQRITVTAGGLELVLAP